MGSASGKTVGHLGPTPLIHRTVNSALGPDEAHTLLQADGLLAAKAFASDNHEYPQHATLYSSPMLKCMNSTYGSVTLKHSVVKLYDLYAINMLQVELILGNNLCKAFPGRLVAAVVTITEYVDDRAFQFRSAVVTDPPPPLKVNIIL